MEQNFFFVDGLNANRTSKKLMRRHVMKGKNAGKTLHRPSRLSQVVQPRHINKVARPIGNPFLTFPFPVPVTKTASKAIYDFFNVISGIIYPVQLGFPLHEDKCKWLEIMFSGEAAYECSLVLIQASNETFLGGGYGCPNTISCLSQTLAQVKKRLEGEDALSDHTLTVIMALINQEQVAQQHFAAEVHMMGLKKIVDLRGGLDQIKEVIVAVKICRTDILFCMQQGGRPIFNRDRMDEIQEVLASRGFNWKHDSDAYSVRHNRLEPALQDVFLDTMEMCRLLNNYMDKPPLNLLEFQELLISICYRLLQFRTLDESRRKSDIHSAHHFGLIIFMLSIYWSNNQSRMVKPGLIASCVRDILGGGLGDEADELILWFLVMGGISVSEGEDQRWIVPRLRETASVLGVTTWDGARSYLTRFPWLNAIHDKPGQMLWDQVRLVDL